MENRAVDQVPSHRCRDGVVKPSSLLALRSMGLTLHQLIHHFETRTRGVDRCKQVASLEPVNAEESIFGRTRSRKSPENPGRFSCTFQSVVSGSAKAGRPENQL
jgi:hypothetical protein